MAQTPCADGFRMPARFAPRAHIHRLAGRAELPQQSGLQPGRICGRPL